MDLEANPDNDNTRTERQNCEQRSKPLVNEGEGTRGGERQRRYGVETGQEFSHNGEK